MYFWLLISEITLAHSTNTLSFSLTLSLRTNLSSFLSIFGPLFFYFPLPNFAVWKSIFAVLLQRLLQLCRSQNTFLVFTLARQSHFRLPFVLTLSLNSLSFILSCSAFSLLPACPVHSFLPYCVLVCVFVVNYPNLVRTLSPLLPTGGRGGEN